MEKLYPNLFTPITVGGVTFRNRMFAAPHNNVVQGNETYPTENAITHYANIAKGGAALVVCGSCQVDPLLKETELFTMADWNIYDISDYYALTYFAQQVDAVHFYGAKASLELISMSYGGFRKYSCIEGGFQETDYFRPLYGPMDQVLEDGTVVHQMPEEEMERLANVFADCAENAARVGFDSILIHGGHGMLLEQFMSKRDNKRTDEYGGSYENRARFALKVLDRIRERVDRKLLIEYRISGDQMSPGGNTIEDTIEYLKVIQDRIDFAHISAGDSSHFPTQVITHPSGFLPPAPNAHLARAVKESGALKIPVITVGAVHDPALMEEIIATGGADIVSTVRGWLADPELGSKARAGRPEDVRPCIKCFNCLDKFRETRLWCCSVNPMLGREHHAPYWLTPATGKKKVVVVGGGPAGMQAAITAADRGHDVIIYEKSDRLGGKINFADHVKFKYDLSRFRSYLVRQVAKRGIDVRLNTKATSELVSAENADMVIAALGSAHIVPNIPGINSKNVMYADVVFDNMDSVGDKVVVIGGGLVGCEIGGSLALAGKNVSILEMGGKMAPDSSGHYLIHLFELLDEKTRCIPNSTCTSITGNGVLYRDSEGQEISIEADTVIIAVGMRANSEEANTFYASGQDFRAVGDCVKARTVMYAVREAFDAVATL